MSYGYTPGAMGSPQPMAPRESSSIAIISLIAGILGLFMIPVIGSIVAIITGGMAKRDIRASSGTIGGEGLATAGVVMGWIGLVLWGFSICIIILSVAGVIGLPFCLTPFFMGDYQLLVPLLLGSL